MPAYGSFTDKGEADILNWLFAGIPLAPPPYWYAGYVVNPAGEEGAGVEPGSGGYSRIPVPNTTANFPVTSNQIKTTDEEILFSRATASHGIVQAVCLWDSPSGGNMFVYSPLEQPLIVDVNDSFRLDPGGWSINFEVGGFTNYLKNALLNHLFGAVVFNPPTIVHLGWTKTMPTDMTPGQEPAPASNYGRLAVPRNTNSFPPTRTGSIALNTLNEFAKSSADQGTATHLALYDASTGGNNLVNGLIARNGAALPKPVPQDAIFTVLPGDLIVSLN